MEITYDFAGKKVKKIGTEPQIGTTYEIEDDDIGLTAKFWRVSDVVRKVTLKKGWPDVCEHTEVHLVPYTIVDAPATTSTE